MVSGVTGSGPDLDTAEPSLEAGDSCKYMNVGVGVVTEHFISTWPGRYWQRLHDGRIQCDVCPRACKLQAGQRGLCLVRASDGTQIILTTYGRSSGFYIDPLEKKPLYHFLPGTATLSFGTAGCNLTCRFCQNWHLSKTRRFDRLLDIASPQTIAQAARRLDCHSVSFTYNEPVIALEYAVDTAQACHAMGIQTVAVTAGYITPTARREFFAHMNAANIDLKAFTEDFYHRLATAHLEPILDTLRYLKHETNVWFELTTLLIPGENDSHREIDAMTRWIVRELGPDVPLHFTAFHPSWKMTDKPPTLVETLKGASAIAKANGMHYVYIGNVHHDGGGVTYCCKCGKRLIARSQNRISYYALTDGGCCQTCGTICAGLFGCPPGRRRPPPTHR